MANEYHHDQLTPAGFTLDQIDPWGQEQWSDGQGSFVTIDGDGNYRIRPAKGGYVPLMNPSDEQIASAVADLR